MDTNCTIGVIILLILVVVGVLFSKLDDRNIRRKP